MMYLHLPSWMIVNLVPRLSCYVISNLRNFKNGCKNLNNNIFWNARRIFLCGNDSPVRRRFGEEYCWAITQPTDWSCCGRSDSTVFKFGFQWDSLVYTYRVVDHMNTQFLFDMDLPVRDYCVRRRVSLWLLPESESVCLYFTTEACLWRPNRLSLC